MKAFKPHDKKCRNPECRKPFRVTTPAEARATWCSTDCALAIVAIKREKARVEKERKERREIREAKEKLKPRKDFVKTLQTGAFNPYIRERDYWDGCISCGKSREQVEKEQGWKLGGAWDAGHYLSVGSHPELRFEPDNCHKQCKSCNGGSGQFGRKERTVSAEYRERLIAKIGLERVLWLEGPQEPRHYTVDELKAMTKKYRALRRELVKAREAGAHGGGTSW